MTRERARAWLRFLAAMEREERRRVFRALPAPVARAIAEEWWWQAHGGQVEPEACADGAPWHVWAIVAGRGFGKTRAGAEWVWARARECPEARIALLGATLEEVAKVMVEGESGLLQVARSGEAPRWLPSRGTFRFPSGAMAFAHTADCPARLRGPQHHFAWADELAKWRRGDAAWDNLMLGLRLGDRPRAIVTTTPQPVPLMKRVLAMPRCVETNGRTDENRHLAPDFVTMMRDLYGKTRLGRQELEGLLLEDMEGALWTRDMIENARASVPPPWEAGRAAGSAEPGSIVDLRFFQRIVVGVDPPAGTGGNACGILVCGLGGDGILYVLADLSVSGLRPEGWARRVAAAAESWGASRVVAEKNQGGDMVESVLRGADDSLPVKLVSATKGKAARAEPVALRFETGTARLASSFPELEDELCAITYAGYERQGSPDRADAMIWAMTELSRSDPEPRVRML